MSQLADHLKSTPRNTLVIQIVLLLIGVLASVALVIFGFLQESVFEVFESPLTGILFQFYSFVIIELNPIMILLIGSMGFIGFYVIPGMIVTYRFLDNLDFLSRILFGTGFSVFAMFFPIFYLLLLGIAPNWILLSIPLILSIISFATKPEIMRRFAGDALAAFNWLKNDVKDRKQSWFWIIIGFVILTRISFFSLTDSYWTDSVTYVLYGNAIADGSLLTGLEYTNPIGFPVVVFPFTWLAGNVEWGLALGNWCLTFVMLLGAIPLLRRLHNAWPTEKKPPFRLMILAFVTFPWTTALMTTIFHEATLMFFTILGTAAIGMKMMHGEVWLGLSVGIAFLIRPTHALMYFIFMLVPLYYQLKERNIQQFFVTGFKSFSVALPVIPFLIRNLAVEGTLLSTYDLGFFSLGNIIDVSFWFASFITHSDVGLFSLLFVLQLVILFVLFLMKLRKLNYELVAWAIFSVVSFVIFALYPTDQPRLFSFFLWLVPVFLLYECWDRNWELTAGLMLIWQILIFGAIPFSPQGWIIDGASSHLVNVNGIVRPQPETWMIWSIASIMIIAIFWIILLIYSMKEKEV